MKQIISLLPVFLVVGCQVAQEHSEGLKSQLVIELPEPIYLNQLAPQSLDGSLCYLVNVRASDIKKTSSACFPELGVYTSLLSPGTEIELSIPSGEKREIELWGYHPQAGQTCDSLGLIQLEQAPSILKSDRFYLLGKTAPVDLTRAVETVSLDISVPNPANHYASTHQVSAACPRSEIVSNPPGAVTCPTGYIAVPGVPPLTATSFCVAKYEMKKVGAAGSEVATSQADGKPWVDITRDEAIVMCNELGSNYKLISNAHWQTIARDIATVGWNWSNGVAPSGSLNIGHTNNNNIINPNGAVPAVESDFCFGTQLFAVGETCSATQWHSQRRVHQLSNSEQIWDFSGNVWEWVADDYSSMSISDSVTTGTYNFNLTNLGSFLNKFGPSTALDSETNRIGKITIGNMNDGANEAIVRGGAWDNISFNLAGIFSVSIRKDHPTTTSGIYNGFRCVYEPQ